MAERVLVSGGTGLIGGRLVAALRAAGARVRVLTRSAKATARAGDAGTEFLQWDGIRLPDGALRGCGAVVHLAGEPVFGGPPTAARRRRIASSRIASTESIADSLRATAAGERPATFVCASAVGYYGSRGEERLSEASGPGTGWLSEICQHWEAAAAAASDCVRVVSLRTGIALARDGGALPMLALPFRLGLGGRFGDGRQWVPWIQVDDAVSAIRRALSDASLSGPINLTAPNPVRNAELSRAVARALHRPCLLPVPAFALRAALGPLGDELLGSRRCVPQRLLDAGFEFAHPQIETALAAELARGD